MTLEQNLDRAETLKLPSQAVIGGKLVGAVLNRDKSRKVGRFGGRYGYYERSSAKV